MLLKDAQNSGIPLMSVAGGSWKEGNWLASAGFCGPGSSRLVRLFPLILPCGGESGLPNVAADAAADMPRAAADAAAPSRISRRDKPFIGGLTGYLGDGQCCGLPFPRNFGGLAQDYVCNIVCGVPQILQRRRMRIRLGSRALDRRELRCKIAA